MATRERHRQGAERPAPAAPNIARTQITIDATGCQGDFRSRAARTLAGTVVEVWQPGYVLHDRLLHPAMVGAAKGDRA